MFEFVDNFEREVADFLGKYNKMAWGKSGITNIEDVSLLSEDDKNIWPYFERAARVKAFNKTLAKYRGRLDRIEDKEINYDEVEKQRLRLEQIDIILGHLNKLPLYKRLEKDDVAQGVDLNLIQEIELALRGASLQMTLDRAEEWATKENASEDKKIVAALKWLTSEEWLGKAKLTNLEAIRLLQEKWGVKPGWKENSTIKTRVKELKQRFVDTVPNSPP